MAKCKQEGKTEVYPFWYMEDIKNMMNFFREKKMWHWHLVFNFGLFLGRRVSDTVSFKWSDFFFPNGRMKDETEIKEWKTGKIARLYINGACKEALQFYIEKTGTDPIDNFDKFIVGNARMNELLERKTEYDSKEYDYLMLKATQSYIAGYRKQFKIGADYCGIKYPVSTHSTRKTFGYWSVKLHPYDLTTVDKLQGIFNHSDRNMTLRYVGIAREDEVKLYDDMGNFVKDIMDGKKPIIKNSPVIPLKAENFRELLSKVWDMGHDGKDKFESINEAIGMAEQSMV